MTDRISGKRRRYDEDFKRQVVSETFEKGVSVASVARRHGLNANMVFLWRRDRRFSNVEQVPQFLPVEVAADTPLEPSPVTNPASDRRIEIELGRRARVCCLEDISEEILTRVLSAVRRVA